MKKYLLIAAILLFSTPLAAQHHRSFAFHISNPLSLITKVRVKGEFRFDTSNSLLVSHTQYWGLFPCYMSGLEYRRYRAMKKGNQLYFYAMAGFGNSTNIIIWENLGAEEDSNPGPIYYGGAGFGKHVNFGHFFVDVNLGLKATVITNKLEDYFYIYNTFGPGAVVCFNFNFGYQSHRYSEHDPMK